MVHIDEKLCKGCGICIELCPKKALGFNADRKSSFLEMGGCIGCGMCQLWCPDYAISVEK